MNPSLPKLPFGHRTYRRILKVLRLRKEKRLAQSQRPAVTSVVSAFADKPLLPKLPFGHRTYRRILKVLRIRKERMRAEASRRRTESAGIDFQDKPNLPKLPFGHRTYRRILKILRLREERRIAALNNLSAGDSTSLADESPAKSSVGASMSFSGARSETLIPFLVQFEYSHCASPASVGLSDDSRLLALGFRTLKLQEVLSKKIICDVIFHQTGNAQNHILYGFSDIESWGTWSLGRGSAVILWLSSEPIGPLILTLEGTAFEGVKNNLDCTITTNLGHRVTLVDLSSSGSHEAVMEQSENHHANSFFGAALRTNDSSNCSLRDDVPVVSVIILNFNKPLLSILSALSVISSRIGVLYEILIVDNGSSSGNYEILRTTNIQARIVRLPVNRFFGEGNNLGAAEARGEFLLFLNNDAFLSPGCVDSLLDAFHSESKCGAVGPVFYYPDGSLQEAGAFINADGSALQRGKFNQGFNIESLPKYSAVDYISAACLLMRAERFVDVGGFNYRFDPAYYEDVDLCFRVLLRGEITVLARDATCFHIENATTSDKKNNAGSSNVVGHNRNVFLSIWGAYLANRTLESLPKSLLPLTLTKRAQHRELTQATFSPYPLVPGGGERYILAATLALNQRAPAAFVTPDPYSTLRLDSVMFDLGLQTSLIDIRDVSSIVKTRLERFVLMGNEVYPSTSVPADRSFFICQFPFPLNAQQKSNVARGLDRLATYEKVIVYSDFAKKAYENELAKYGRSMAIEVVNPPVATGRLLKLQRPRQPWILSIGRFTDKGHSKRQDVLIEALKATSASFRKEWKLILCGGVPNDPGARTYFQKLQESVDSTVNVEFVISPSADKLDELLAQSSVYAHGAGFGVTGERELWRCEHFGITMVEAMAAGCELFAYEVGGGPELIRRIGSGKTYRTVDQLASLLESAECGGTDMQTRERVAREFGDQVFFDRFIAATQ
jgi:O-antigen biosynthesis protein